MGTDRLVYHQPDCHGLCVCIYECLYGGWWCPKLVAAIRWGKTWTFLHDTTAFYIRRLCVCLFILVCVCVCVCVYLCVCTGTEPTSDHTAIPFIWVLASVFFRKKEQKKNKACRQAGRNTRVGKHFLNTFLSTTAWTSLSSCCESVH